MKLRHYVSFINPRTKQRETIWFPTKRRRDDFIADLQQDFGMIEVREWESPESAYDPSFCQSGEDYEGGLLLVTEDPEQAMEASR